MIKNVVSIIDGSTGSCGKGKVIGEIASCFDYNILASITNSMPNAGHTVVIDKPRVFKNIPASIVNPNCELFIGPGSVIDVDDFILEYESNADLLGSRKIYVHEMVPIILKEYIHIEKLILNNGSTFKGCSGAMSDKIFRICSFFKGYKNAIVLNNDDWLSLIYKHLNNPDGLVLLEGSQGCDLSLNHSGNYPYTTSRNVSTAQLLADCGISPERLLETIMVIRPFPIRISNNSIAGYFNTGEYGRGCELTWSHINYSSLMGMYPTLDIFDFMQIDIDYDYIFFLKTYLNQDNLSLLDNLSFDTYSTVYALEVERLFYKQMGSRYIKSKILNINLYDLSENTTVTKKERRIFDLDASKLFNNCLMNTPSGIYLNFFQHLNFDYNGLHGDFNTYYFDRYLREYFHFIEENCNSNIVALGTGASNGDFVFKSDFISKKK